MAKRRRRHCKEETDDCLPADAFGQSVKCGTKSTNRQSGTSKEKMMKDQRVHSIKA